MLRPLLLQRAADLALRFGVDDVDRHAVSLKEAIDAVDGLDEVIELVSDAQKDGLGAVVLKVAAAPEHHGLGDHLGDAALGEVDDAPSRVSRSCAP